VIARGQPGRGDALLEGLRDGRVGGIATDHSPHTREEKLNHNIWKAISGFAGVETSVRDFITYAVNAGRMTLNELARASSAEIALRLGDNAAARAHATRAAQLAPDDPDVKRLLTQIPAS
jgi:dihydroorotase